MGQPDPEKITDAELRRLALRGGIGLRSILVAPYRAAMLDTSPQEALDILEAVLRARGLTVACRLDQATRLVVEVDVATLLDLTSLTEVGRIDDNGIVRAIGGK